MQKPQIEKVILVCPNAACGQRLAIPYTSEVLYVTCPTCGTHFAYSETQTSADTGDEPGAKPGGKHISQARPWVRYLARMIDLFLGSLVLVLILSLAWPSALKLPDVLFGIAALFFLVFVEAFLISTFGRTPGKWLLRIKLRTSNGQRLSFPQALKRSFRVWYRGLGLGLPIISLITLIVAYRNLKRHGITTWDRDAQLVVSHKKIGFTRAALALLLFGGFAYLIVQSPDEELTPEQELGELLRQPRGNISLSRAPVKMVHQFWQEMGSRAALLSLEQLPAKRELSTTELAQRYSNSIVYVETYDRNGVFLASASGVVLSDNGAIVTNRHVVVGADRVIIRSCQNRAYAVAFLLADYASIDIIILSATIPLGIIVPAPLGDSSRLEIGNRVVAIGNPLGLEGTVSEGIISGFRETGRPQVVRLLQTTAPISPGSSGGALFNQYGELIGITSIGSERLAQNINFAVPIDAILKHIQRDSERAQILRHQRESRSGE